jgi:hypothetical protein
MLRPISPRRKLHVFGVAGLQTGVFSCPSPVLRCDYTDSWMPLSKTSAKRSNGKRRPLSSSTVRGFHGLRLLQIPAFSKLLFLLHAFFTRRGGISQLNGQSALNLCFTDLNSCDNVLENRRCFQFALAAQ